MKQFASVLILFFIGGFEGAVAQAPLVKMWDARFGGTEWDEVTCLQQTKDGGFILGGWSESGASGDKTQNLWGGIWNDFWVVKIDSLGNKQWDKSYGGTGIDHLWALQKTTDGGYILGGVSNSIISGDKSEDTKGEFDFWIVKIDSLGNKQWDKDYGGIDTDELSSLQQTNDKGYILGGLSLSGISGDKTQAKWGLIDCWVIKIDSLGNKQWDKDFGGINYNYLQDIRQTTDGGYIYGGYSTSGIGGDKTQATKGGKDYWIVKIDYWGIKEWDKDFGGTGDDQLYSLQQTSDAGYILGGSSTSGISGDKTQATYGNDDYWIIKIDSIGDKQWDMDFGGSKKEDGYGNLFLRAGGEFLLCGGSYSQASGNKSENNLGLEQSWLVKMDSLGSKHWDKTVFTSGHDEGGLVIQTSDGCYVVANYSNGGIGGYKTQSSWNNSYDYWIVKFCDTTSIAPTLNFSSSDTTFCSKQSINFTDLSTNNPTSWQWYFPGAVPDTSTAQNPTGIYYANYGSYDVALVACNAVGCDSLFLPGFITELQNPPAPVITQTGDTLFSSTFYSYKWVETNNPTIVLSTDSIYVTTQPGSYYVLGCDSFGCCTPSNVIVIAGVEEFKVQSLKFKVIPNPNTGSFMITTQGIYAKELEITVYNYLGEKIFTTTEKNITGSFSKEINLSSQPAGIYVVRVSTDKLSQYEKVIVLK